MEISSSLPIKSQEEVNPVKARDYFDEEGLLHCGVCGRKKQTRIQIRGFSRVVPCICDCIVKACEEERQKEENRQKMARTARLKSSSMIADSLKEAGFSRYVERKDNAKALKVARKYVQNFREMEKQNQGIIFYGPVGTGKSFTAACIANALMEQAVSVIMTSFVKILQDIQSGEMTESKYIEIMDGVSLLIIDDLGAERNTDYALEKVYNVIDSRVRKNSPMILTTNLTMQELMTPTDIRYGRIYDRILEVCYPVELSGPSFRRGQAAERFEKMTSLFE